MCCARADELWLRKLGNLEDLCAFVAVSTGLAASLDVVRRCEANYCFLMLRSGVQ